MSREEMDYQKAYEEEHLRNADLAGRVADLEAKVDDLNFKLNRIKSNPVLEGLGTCQKVYALVHPSGDKSKELRLDEGRCCQDQI